MAIFIIVKFVIVLWRQLNCVKIPQGDANKSANPQFYITSKNMVLYVKIFKKFDDFCFVNFFIFTINVPVVFMARYVMVLRGATSLRGALEGVGPEN